ncbi:hypothetical protein [Gimesia sp.]|uniref:hypothetical protein n=1 Tax=Gimesia sp. TaxID=2024833 RepID=UPI003A8CCF2E
MVIDWHTLPGNLGMRTISLCAGENKLRTFDYLGKTLWESENYNQNRTTQLSAKDSQWLDSIFASIPQSEGERETEAEE